MIRLVTFTLLALAIAWPVEAQPRRELTTLATLDGPCTRFIAHDIDVTDKCEHKALNSEYTDSRTSFTFTSRDGAVVVTFSGNGKAEIHEGPDVALLPIDAVLFGFQGQTDTIKTVGTCRFSNPYKGAASIVCDAQTEQGEFAATFMSDGDPPSLKRLR